MTPRFVVGIDLGTSNCALAYADTSASSDAVTPIVDFPIPQWRSLGELIAQPTLPSCLYLPHPNEFPAETLRLPWDLNPAPPQPTRGLEVVGEWARSHGARVPGRLVASAKSWLCHPGVDRSARILPWGAADDAPRVSPVEASAHYLTHLAHAWNHAHPDHPLADQDLVLTVPASFDAVARNLTIEAARHAGLSRCTLVEEPQAAFHAFLHHARQHRSLAASLAGIRWILVVDVGGGTTDFTLVRVEPAADEPSFHRVAVGDHLMLGGDNMDAALARHAETRLAASGKRLGATQWTQLVQACRRAKEQLLQPHGPDSVTLAIAASGSALLGNTLSTTLTRADVERIVVDGFFAACGPDASATAAPRTALRELGLPYAKDPVITRQLAGFLRDHREAGWRALGVENPSPAQGLPRPDAVLLNGGVFNAQALSERLLSVLSSWWPNHPPIPTLPHVSLDLAVARGAASHGLSKRGLSKRIAGGSSHAIYVGLANSGSESATRTALCVIPRGWEEGETAELGERTFHLTLGRPVQFPLYSSTSDRFEKPGDLVPLAPDLKPLPPLHALLRSQHQASAEIQVHLRATLTEIGTLDLACVSNTTSERWRLEFELRAMSAETEPQPVESLPARFTPARADLERVFAPKTKNPPANAAPADTEAAAKAARQLPATLEKHLGPRDTWNLPVLRELWTALLAGASRRRRSADHERTFFQLAGFALRPGFGYPLDDWRCEQAALLFAQGVTSVRDPATWNAFWVHWRRIAAGLSAERHHEIWTYLRPHLAFRIDPDQPKHAARPKGVQPEGVHEMARLAASLDHLSTADKTELGRWIIAQLRQPNGTSGPWAWALGRLGSRVSWTRKPSQTVSPELAAVWMEELRQAHERGADGALFAMVQTGRLTGDRARDLDEAIREKASDTLRKANAPAHWLTLLTEVAELDSTDEARALGDTLPVGLRLS